MTFLHAGAWGEAQLWPPLRLLPAVFPSLPTSWIAGLISVKFGKLFDATQDIFEALVGTLRSAKKKKLIRFEGEMLLKGAHDNVDIVLLQPQQQQ